MKTYTPVQRFWMLAFANAVFIFHFALVLTNIFGWLLPGWFFYVYLTTWMLAFVVDVLFAACPLTYLEFSIRRKLDPQAVFEKSCIVHYIRKWRGLTPRSSVTPQTKTFAKRYSFIFIMLGLLLLSLLWQVLVYKRDIFYFG